MSQSRRHALTAQGITAVVLPVIYAGTSLRLLAVLRSSNDPAVRAMAVALAATAAGASTLPPSALTTLEAVLGDANYGRFLSQIGTVVAASAGNEVMLRSAFDRVQAEPKVSSRRRRTAGTLLLMGALFARDRATAAELQLPTDRIFEPRPALYWITFAQFMVQAAGETGRLAFSSSHLARDGALRTGLRCVGTGTLVLSGYYAHQVIGIVGRLLVPGTPGPVRGAPAQAVIGAAAALIAVGASAPGVVWHARKAQRVVDDTRMAASLKPLWQRFRTSSNATLSVGLGSPELRLYRRVMEILDGLDMLARDRDPHGLLRQRASALGRQHQWSEDDVTALTRAALLRSGPAPAGQVSAAPAQTDHCGTPATTAAHRDWRTEARRLLRTASYLRHSTLPTQIAEHASAATQTDRRTTAMTTDPVGASDTCTCLKPGSDEVAYLDYAVGRQERDTAIGQARADCSVHGESRIST